MKKHVSDPDGRFFKVIDIDTGKNIPRVKWADDETGLYGQIKVDKEGNIVLEEGYGGKDIVVETKKGNIKLIDTRITA